MVVFYDLLQIAQRREADSHVKSMLEGPIKTLQVTYEDAGNFLHKEYTPEVSRVFWNLIKQHFDTPQGKETLAGKIEAGIAKELTAEIERQFAELAKQTPAAA